MMNPNLVDPNLLARSVGGVKCDFLHSLQGNENTSLYVQSKSCLSLVVVRIIQCLLRSSNFCLAR
ncbi:Glucose-6-phosphate isomerase [Gossypium arboreum]|uniref:Glucose-6-phosphate isomerase n=1 Tax=Gossypium arboreum TaxID=29729 RepID=A0A0B0PJ39_GOSAR|nr:Glucose-6-phosphate isomerase [Gossypium arboreum]